MSTRQISACQSEPCDMTSQVDQPPLWSAKKAPVGTHYVNHTVEFHVKASRLFVSSPKKIVISDCPMLRAKGSFEKSSALKSCHNVRFVMWETRQQSRNNWNVDRWFGTTSNQFRSLQPRKWSSVACCQ